MARKVLFYTHAFGGGGAEVVFARLAQAFADTGDDVVFAADHAGPSPVQDRTSLRHIHMGAGHASATRRLAKLLAEEKPDASFSALGAQNLKHLAAAILAGRRSRCVLGYHGFAISEPKRLSRSCFWLSPIVTHLAACSICVSDALLDNIRDHWHASRRKTMRIYNPLPAAAPAVPADDTFERATLSAGDTPPLIVGCGRLVAGKRFADLVAALAAVQPGTARLALLGDGPEMAALRDQVRRLGLSARVDLPGHVADPSLWYRRAACVAITSESESFGLTAAEALAHGVPVVTTDCNGPVEILDHGLYGRIVPVGDVAALARALTATLAAPGPEAPRRERAKSFALASIQRQYSDLIDTLG